MSIGVRAALAALVFVVGCVSAARAELVLAEGGKSAFKIQVTGEKSPVLDYAAQELQRWVKEISAINEKINQGR